MNMVMLVYAADVVETERDRKKTNNSQTILTATISVGGTVVVLIGCCLALFILGTVRHFCTNDGNLLCPVHLYLATCKVWYQITAKCDILHYFAVMLLIVCAKKCMHALAIFCVVIDISIIFRSGTKD